MKLFLDIETIPTEDAAVIAEIAAAISPPGNISKPESIAAWETEKKPALVEEAVRKTAFDGGLGELVCIGYATDDAPALALVGRDERDMIADLFQLPIRSCSVIGHNIGWDVRFIWKRAVVHRLSPPTWLRLALQAKPWDGNDTMTLWEPERDRRPSLAKLCRALGVPTPKDKMDGSQVYDYWKAGRITEIAEYCRGDVEAMRECYRRMTFADAA